MGPTPDLTRPFARKNLLPKRPYFLNQFSITGMTGSGKSALVELLLPELDRRREPNDPPYEFLSGGKIKRTEALKPRHGYPKGFRLKESPSEADMVAFTAWEAEHPEFKFDEVCDEQIRKFSTDDYRVCEGRLAHLFMLHAFKILIRCNPRIRAERRAKKYGVPYLQAMSWISDRDDNDRRRYEILYPGYDWNLDDFDLVITNEGIAEKELADIALNGHRAWLKRIASNLIVPVCN